MDVPCRPGLARSVGGCKESHNCLSSSSRGHVESYREKALDLKLERKEIQLKINRKTRESKESQPGLHGEKK